MTILIIALTFLWGVGSLFLVAAKTNSVKTIFLKKPSIIIGDSLLLPTIAGIISNYYLHQGIEDLFSSVLIWVILIISLVLAIISAIRFELLHPLWLPHILFYWYMAFIVLLFLSTLETSPSWWLVLTGIITHQVLGILFPKKFPEIDKT